MESVYMPNKIHPNVTDVMDLSRYFFDYNSTLNTIPFVSGKKKVQKFFNFLNVDKEDYAKLRKKFSISKYSWKGKKTQDTIVLPVKGFKIDFKLYGLPADRTLKSLEYLREQGKEDDSRRRRQLRYTGQIDCEDNIESYAKDLSKEKLTECSEFLLSVRVYIPNPHCSFSLSKRSRPFQVSQEFLVYGHLTLDKLKDRILCPEDYQSVEGDVSKNPFTATTVRNRDVYKSSVFFINDIFYVDTRHIDFVDYSEVIKNWASIKKIPLHITKTMQDYKFNSLQFRLGYPYLYMHQGNCEHIIVFTDARLLNPQDLLVKNAYPVMTSYAGLRGRQCMLCSKKTAKFLVIDTDRLPVLKTHLCAICLYQYCYIDGKKTDDFTVYKYLDRVALL